MSTLNALKRRVLIVEDEAVYGIALQQELTDKGFEVEWVRTLEEGRKAIRAVRHHFVLLDLHLHSVDVRNPHGIELAREIRDCWPEGSKEAFMLLTADDMREVAGYRNAVGGRLFSKKTLEQCVAEAMQVSGDAQLTGYNWALRIGDTTPTNIAIAMNSGANIADEKLKSAMEDLVRQFFRSEASVNIAMLGETGFSGAQLFKIAQPSSKGRPRMYALKVADKEDIEKEAQALSNHVEPYGFDVVPQLKNVAFARNTDVGGIQYHLVTEAIPFTKVIIDANSDDAIEECCRFLRRCFDALSECWYSSSSIVRWDTTQEVFDSTFCQNAVTQFDRCFSKYSKSKANSEFRYSLRGCRAKVRNPIQYLPLAIEPSDFPKSIVHGDLHSGNILVKDKSRNIALIDIASTRDGRSPFVDFAKFETHLIMDLMNSSRLNVDLPGRLAVLSSLYSSPDFLWDWQNRGNQTRNQEKAAKILICLRSLLNDFVNSVLSRMTNTENSLSQYRNYCADLFYWYTKCWNWLDHQSFTEEDRYVNLVACSLVLDRALSAKSGQDVTEISINSRSTS